MILRFDEQSIENVAWLKNGNFDADARYYVETAISLTKKGNFVFTCFSQKTWNIVPKKPNLQPARLKIKS